MLENIKSYDIRFIQKASPRCGDAFDFSYIYKFYTDRTKSYQRLKYIIRVEVIKDIYAIKFYAARDRKLDNKYNRLLKAHSYSDTLRIFVTCANIVPIILLKHPLASFIINGAQSLDLQTGKIEDKSNNQRFRIYRYITDLLFGKVLFKHYEFDEISSYLIVNTKSCADIEVDEKKNEIRLLLVDTYDIEL